MYVVDYVGVLGRVICTPNIFNHLASVYYPIISINLCPLVLVVPSMEQYPIQASPNPNQVFPMQIKHLWRGDK